MYSSRFCLVALAVGLAAWFAALSPTKADEVQGVVKSVDLRNRSLVLTEDGTHREISVRANVNTAINAATGKKSGLGALKPGAHVVITDTLIAAKIDAKEPATAASPAAPKSALQGFWYNFRHNLFKPLLLFFYLGFLVPVFRVKFEFPYVIYQGLTIYLLVAIGWHGGEELSRLDPRVFGSVFGFMAVGFATNFVVGILAYLILRSVTRLRRIDCATVAGFYGSDSAGTFVTCLGVLGTINIAFDAYMPVMLAVMEIPGCLVALYLVARLRHQGMDPLGDMPDEAGYDPNAKPLLVPLGGHGHGDAHLQEAIEDEKKLSLEEMEHEEDGDNEIAAKSGSVLSPKLLHEVFLNPGLFLLFGGILIGFISGLQGPEVTRADDNFFVTLFQGVLCLFLLEMGMTASRKLRDLKTAGLPFILFGLLAPNLFATMGIVVAHLYSAVTHTPFELGTYVLFAVLCGSASYIAVPAVQRLAIPEASPTLPLAASLGLTFSYNVTIGIPVYIEIAKQVTRFWPV